VTGDPRTLATIPEVAFPDGSRAAVELILSGTPAPEGEVFAALVLLQDAQGCFAVVYSPRREEWASPGGFREAGETATQTVVREVHEETGLRLSEQSLVACGYERFRPLSPTGRWPEGGGCLQVFRTRLAETQPPLAAGLDDVTDHRWVTASEFEALCGEAFWWPLAQAVLARPAPELD
jgi:ADP-ribose pyrophosphatase YjhB (NUDIX family)